jgi:hypothetical protein
MNLESQSLIAKYTDWSDQRVLKIQRVIAYVELAVAVVYAASLVLVPIIGLDVEPFDLIVIAAMPILLFLVSDRRLDMIENYKKINNI